MTFPPAFENQLSYLSDTEKNELRQALDEPSITSIRVNPAKWNQPVNQPKVLWSDQGYYLEERPNFTCDPLLHAGTYYVQEASSMVIGYVLKTLLSGLPENAVMLDLCAAPGGKSTDLAASLRKGDVLVSNEVIQSRARILKENVIRWGSTSHWVSSNDPEDFKQLPGLFDLVLVDAPCSGEGLFRKDPEALNEWSPDAVSHCRKRQQRILADAWDCIAEGGFLIYATCTYNQSENEEVLDWLRVTYQIEPVEVPVEKYGFQCFERNDFPLYKAFPHLVEGEGFSFFVVRKREQVQTITQNKKRKKDQRKRVSVEGFIQNPIENGLVIDDVLYYSENLKLRDLMAERLKFVRSGLRIGEYKKKKLIPDHELALSQIIRDPFPAIDLSYEQAVNYLKKEIFNLSTHEKGYHLVRYRGVSLGLINHLGNRFNSLFPASFRIHSQKCLDGDPQII